MGDTKKMIVYSLVYGLMIGVISVIFELLLYIFGKLNDNMISLIIMFIFIFGISLSIRHYRDTINNGFIDFRNAFKIGFQASFFTAVVGALFSYVKFKYLSPHLVDEMLTMAREIIVSKGLSEQDAEMQTAILNKLMTPGYMSVFFVINRCFWGSILSLLLAYSMKREKNTFQSDNSGLNHNN